jgi:hypothetical protein
VRSTIRFDPSWIFVLLLAVFAVAPLTYPGFFEAQSGFLPAFNVEHLSDAPNWGRQEAALADPLRGEGKLPYLLAWPFLQVTGSGIAAIKWGYALAFGLGALGFYAWTRRWLASRGAVLSAVVYTYLPWHLSTVYQRGAYAEAWLWAFWPFILWAIDRLATPSPRNTLVAIAVGLPLLAATFWTQPGLAALAVPLLAAYAVTVPTKGPWTWARLLEALGLSLLLLWIVARRLPESSIPFAKHLLQPYQLLSAAWGEALSFQLGLAAVGLSIITVALLLSRRHQEGAETAPSYLLHLKRAAWFWRTIRFWRAALLVLVLLSLTLSNWLWQVTGLHSLLTYPWQLLALTGLPLAFLAGSVIRLDQRLATLPAWAGLVALVVLASYPYLAPKFTGVDPGPEPVALLQPVGAGAPQVMLLDYDIAPATEITPTLTLTLTWQAVEPVTDDHTVFVHLLAGGDKVAQRDTYPCDGECPTSTWLPGELILDRYQLDLPPYLAAGPGQLPPGPYQLAIGLYLLDSGDRAAVVGRDDQTVYIDVP